MQGIDTEEALRHFKNKKKPKADNINAEFYKLSPTTSKVQIFDHRKPLSEINLIQSDCGKSLIIPIFKKGLQIESKNIYELIQCSI